VQRSWALHLIFIQRLGGIFDFVGSPGKREGRGDQRRGHARTADRAPVEHVLHFGFFVAVELKGLRRRYAGADCATPADCQVSDVPMKASPLMSGPEASLRVPW